MKCHVMTEGAVNAALLEALLAGSANGDGGLLEVSYGRDQYETVTYARLHLKRGARVALVLDALTTHARRIEELRLMFDDSLGQVGPRSLYGIFLAVPALAGCLFLDRAGMQRLFGAELTEERGVRARFDPESVVQELLATRGDSLTPPALETLVAQLDAECLRRFPVIQALLDFLTREPVGATLASPA